MMKGLSSLTTRKTGVSSRNVGMINNYFLPNEVVVKEENLSSFQVLGTT